MGDPTRRRKLYEKPKKLWNAKRILEESELRDEYGLKNAKELWRMQTILRKIRREARRLLSGKGADAETRAGQLLTRVKNFLISKQDASLDDVLSLSTKDILNRRLQTIVWKRGLAKTQMQSRQLIAHGHVGVDGKRVTAPSYLVKFSEEKQVNWYKHAIAVQAPVKAASASASEATLVKPVSVAAPAAVAPVPSEAKS